MVKLSLLFPFGILFVSVSVTASVSVSGTDGITGCFSNSTSFASYVTAIPEMYAVPVATISIVPASPVYSTVVEDSVVLAATPLIV